MSPRVLARRTLIAGALLALWAPAAAPARERTTVALIGDSIVESSHLAHPRTQGLAAALRRELRRRGYDPGGEGFLPAHFVEQAFAVGARAGAADWYYRGGWLWFTAPGLPGTVPLFSWTTDPGATASLRARADTTSLVYLTGPALGSFRFDVAGRRGRIDARAPSAGVATRRVTLPSSGRPRSIRVGDVRGGGLGLAGAFLRRRPARGRRQIEISALGWTGARGGEPDDPVVAAGLAALAPRITVLMLGSNDAIVAGATGDRAIYPALERGILARALRARRSGACIVVPPGRGWQPPDVVSAVQGAERSAAREAGCAYAPVLDVLDRHRSLTVDGLHPRARGYELVARALAPVIAARVR